MTSKMANRIQLDDVQVVRPIAKFTDDVSLQITFTNVSPGIQGGND